MNKILKKQPPRGSYQTYMLNAMGYFSIDCDDSFLLFVIRLPMRRVTLSGFEHRHRLMSRDQPHEATCVLTSCVTGFRPLTNCQWVSVSVFMLDVGLVWFFLHVKPSLGFGVRVSPATPKSWGILLRPQRLSGASLLPLPGGRMLGARASSAGWSVPAKWATLTNAPSTGWS